MIILDIINNIDNIQVGNDLIIIFKSNYEMNSINKNNPFIHLSKINNKQKIKIKILDFLGKGSFGVVFKFEYNNKLYAFKFNSNEIPEKMCERYLSIKSCKKLENYFINIHCCGNINSDKFKYFTIMDYGGSSLKVINCIYERPVLYYIIFQLTNIVYNIIKYKILLPDFKLNNLTIDEQYNIKIIDFYVFCDNYNTCQNCKIIKTYAPIEMQLYRNIFDLRDLNSLNYNYTYICLPFVFCLIDIMCKYKTNFYLEKLAKKFNIKNILTTKEIINMIQISSFNYNKNENTNFDKKYQKINIYKKTLEDKYPFIKSNDFYEYFFNMIHIKDEYSSFIPHEQFLLLINDLINLDPNKRDLNMMFIIVKIIAPEIKYKPIKNHIL
jgi:hypothetical protein